MIRTLLALGLPLIVTISPTLQAAEIVLPTTYELSINGEVFQVELGKPTTVKSQDQPGVDYKLSLGVAPEQSIRLETVQFDYARTCRALETRGQGAPTATLSNDLGFTMIITDLGGMIDTADRSPVMKLLVERMVRSFIPTADGTPVVSEEKKVSFDGLSGNVVSIQYRDKDGYDRTCVVYLLADDTHACSCIVQYLNENAVAIAPVVQKTLDSIRPVNTSSQQDSVTPGEPKP